METFAFEAIGTRWTIELRASSEAAEVIMAVVHARIEQFDKDWSRFRDDSFVAEVARTDGAYALPEDAEPLMDLYKDLYDRTDGRFTPLIGQALSDAGYDAAYSLQPKTLQPVPAWESVMQYDYPLLTTTEPVLLDVGAAGKGYLVDIVAGMLYERGIKEFVVDAGGDMRIASTDAAIDVGLEDPRDATKAIGVATIKRGSICGSAGNRRAWAGFTHMIDPRTLTSPSGTLAVWVTAETAMVADALATCLFLVPPERLGTYEFEYAILQDDYAVRRSAGFPGEFFPAG